MDLIQRISSSSAIPTCVMNPLIRSCTIRICIETLARNLQLQHFKGENSTSRTCFQVKSPIFGKRVIYFGSQCSTLAILHLSFASLLAILLRFPFFRLAQAGCSAKQMQKSTLPLLATFYIYNTNYNVLLSSAISEN